MNIVRNPFDQTASEGQSDLAPLWRYATEERLERGAVLLREGDAADSLFFVIRGRFSVMAKGRVVAQIGVGEPIGEIAFFAGGQRTADVVAARDSSILKLDRASFDQAIAAHPALYRHLLQVLARRLGRAASQLPAEPDRPQQAMMLVPATGTSLPHGFVENLTKAMEAIMPVRIVRSDDLPKEVADKDENAIADHLFSQQVEAAEGRKCRYLYLAGESDAFNRAAARQSDGLIVVASIQSKVAAPAGLESYASDLFTDRARTLVCWRHHRQAAISGTAKWLATRKPHLHHHVALDTRQDFDRLARFLTGRARGAVLAGGGALGAAHLGVAKALFEGGITVDYWGGTSMGAAIGLALGSEMHPDEVMNRLEEIFVTSRALGRLTFPLYSIFDQSPFDHQLRHHYGDVDLVDLPVHCFAASCNLSTNALHIHRSGPRWEAVRASGSLPAILPPFITEDGEVLVDGAMIDNLPLAAMRELKHGPNIAVALAPDSDWRLQTSYSRLPARGRLAFEFATRRTRQYDLPAIFETLSRSMLVSARRAMAQMGQGDDIFLIPPSVPGMGLLDWRLAREQMQLAYEHTRDRIEQGAFAHL